MDEFPFQGAQASQKKSAQALIWLNAHVSADQCPGAKLGGAQDVIGLIDPGRNAGRRHGIKMHA
jgi:hypothetical protein